MNLTKLDWRLSGWLPWQWQLERSVELGELLGESIPPMEAGLPTSVQGTLRKHGLLADWNCGLNHRLCDWVENLHWHFGCRFTAPETGEFELYAEGLDHAGWVLLDHAVVGEFHGAFREHVIPLPALEAGREYALGIVFACPPRWLGQFGQTSQMSLDKPRFNYTWDWTARLVQLGVTAPLHLRRRDGKRLKLHVFDTGRDSLTLTVAGENLAADAELFVTLSDGGRTLAEGAVRPGESLRWRNLPVLPWQPNGRGEPKLYRLKIESEGCDPLELFPGFRSFRRLPCAGAPEGANPWIFEVNGETVFIQGINWTPIRPNTADVTECEYRERIDLYRRMGVNLFRVWGGAKRERELFYRLCDETGIMVWQEFPLCSSGVDNLPPEDGAELAELAAIASSYADALIAHPSLVLWCGGNELYCGSGAGTPCDGTEPALKLLAGILKERDPGRGFLPTSASGPSEFGHEERFGRGLHHDVHGPWNPSGADLEKEWRNYWEKDDALLRSELGCPGASSPGVLEKYAGKLVPMPVSKRNPFWSRTMDWWLEDSHFLTAHGRPPASAAEYARWSRQRQAAALAIAVGSVRKRFPAAGGVILWMGHDSFPCAVNTSLIDFDGVPKPAAYAIAGIFGGTLAPGNA